MRRAAALWRRAVSSAASDATPIDLARWAPTGPAWASPPRRWVLFSDLHVTPRTLPVAMDVLRRLRDEAAARDAGIAFLGDFWHHRGALPVEPLNALVRLFGDADAWGVRTLMLVGNHDQWDRAGLVHGLTPLAAAAPDTLHVFDGPALYGGALWLPYRRDSTILREAINAADGQIGAVMAHVDVQGASLNDACQARDGLPPSLFPPGVPVFTGHYHKPHTVSGTAIRYVGSPYQVTRAEAGQSKALVVVEGGSEGNTPWHVVDEVPLDLGPRHFEVRLGPGGDGDDLKAAAAAAVKDLRRGDRLRVTVDPESMQSQAKAVKSLSAKGIQIELVAAAPAEAAPRIAAAEDLGPQELFSEYCRVREVSQAALEKGSGILAALQMAQRAQQPHVSLSFSAVEIEGFFSFLEPQRYELRDRGLVVVTGRVEGGAATGAESNGAGKTALVMAPLWALTGDVDARSELGAGRGLTNADVVNDGAKVARVRLEGSVDGIPFVVERKVVRRGRGGGLTFELDGEDRTTQDVRLTQAEIDVKLGARLLGRAAFYGQSEITALLEAGDRAFKEELGKIVDLEVWAAAKEESRRELAAARAAAAEAGTEAEVRQRYVEEQQFEVERLEERLEREREAAAGREEAARAAAAVAATQARAARATLAAAVVRYEAQMAEHADEGSLVDSDELEAQEAELAAAREAAASAQLRRGAAAADAATKARRLEGYSSLGDTCDRCMQPISAELAAETAAGLRAEAEAAAAAAAHADAEAVAAVRRVDEIAAAARAARERQMAALREAAASRAAAEQGVAEGRAALAALEEFLSEEWDDTVVEDAVLDADISLSEALANAGAARASLAAAAAEARAASTSGAAAALVDEVRRRREWLDREQHALEQLTARAAALSADVDALKQVDEAFRPTGVVSFVLEGALGALQRSANAHLAQLAPGVALELSASAAEQVAKRVLVGGVARSVRQLSGGERRRVALALALAFTELAAGRGRLRTDLLVLDEVAQHLDGEGCARLAALLRGLGQFGTVLLVAQARSFMVREFDAVDTVVKRGGGGKSGVGSVVESSVGEGGV